MTGPWVGRVRALVEADLGLVEQARAHAEEGLESARALSQEIFVVLTLGVLGRLELALGNLEGCRRVPARAAERLLAGGLNDPTQPVWADAIETLIVLGELELARSYLDQYEANTRRLGSPRAAWAPPAVVAFCPPLTGTCRRRPQPSRPPSPTQRRFRSSWPAPCSAWAW